MRRGYTLVELLVTVAILATLVGLLLPAVQKVRESAARTQCLNNVKELALACHDYESSHGHLPDGGLSPWAEPGWLRRVENELECRGYPNGWRGVPKVMTCPAYGASTLDYAGNGGAHDMHPDVYPEMGFNGCGRDTSAVRHQAFRGVWLSDIKEGTSNRILLGEKRQNRATLGLEPGPQNNNGWATGWDWDTIRWTSFPPAPAYSDGLPGWFWRDCEDAKGRAFGGAHPGGWQRAMCDGSAAFVTYGGP